jgi:hypothetical protein
MPEKSTIKRNQRDAKEGKAPTTQAGEFVREEIEHIRQGKHGAQSTKQAIAIGLSKARRAGVKLPPPGKNSSSQTRRKAEQDSAAAGKPPSRKRSRATLGALKRESKKSASTKSLSKQTKSAAKNRTAKERSNAARKAARTRKRST